MNSVVTAIMRQALERPWLERPWLEPRRLIVVDEDL